MPSTFKLANHLASIRQSDRLHVEEPRSRVRGCTRMNGWIIVTVYSVKFGVTSALLSTFCLNFPSIWDEVAAGANLISWPKLYRV